MKKYEKIKHKEKWFFCPGCKAFPDQVDVIFVMNLLWDKKSTDYKPDLRFKDHIASEPFCGKCNTRLENAAYEGEDETFFGFVPLG